jgi:hypothetical protein
MVSHTFNQQHQRIILYREAGSIIYEIFQFFFLIQSPSSRQNKLTFKETNIKSGNTLGKAKGLPLACYLGQPLEAQSGRVIYILCYMWKIQKYWSGYERVGWPACVEATG